MNTRQLLSVGIDIGTTTTQVIFSHLELVNRAAVSQVPRYEFIKREISWQSLSVGIDIGTTTTQVIFSHLELVNRAAVSQVPRYEFIKREISWQSPVFFTPVDKQGGLKEAELKTLILEQYQAAGIAPESVDSGAIIITGESAKTRNARPAVMALSRSLGDFVVASAGPHLESVIAGHGAGAQTLSEQRLCRVLNIDIGGGTANYALFDAGKISGTACLNVGGRHGAGAQTLSEQRLCRVLNIDIGGGTANYALFDAGKISGTACLNVGGRLLETDSQGRVVYAHKPGQMITSAVAPRTTPCSMPEKSAALPASTSAVACWKPTARGAWFTLINRGRCLWMSASAQALTPVR